MATCLPVGYLIECMASHLLVAGRVRLGWLYLTLLCCSSPLAVQADGFLNGHLGHYGLSMGQATPSLAYDASTAFFNPGAMAMLRRRLILQFGSHIVRHNTTFVASPPVIYQEDMDTVYTSRVFLYAFFRGRQNGSWNRWSIGLSVTSPYGLTSRWPEEPSGPDDPTGFIVNGWRGRFISQEFSISSLLIQPTFAYQVSPELGLGFGFSFGVVSLLSRRAIPLDGLNVSSSSVSFGGNGTGTGLNLGLFWQPKPNLAIGINAKTPMLFRINEGDATFAVPMTFESEYPSQRFQTEFTMPGEVQAGVSIWPQENVQLAFAVKYRMWQSFDSLVFELDESVGDFPTFPERNYRNTTSLHIGADYTYNERLAFRGGMYYDASPVQADYLSPEFPDGDKIGFTLGIEGKLSRRLTIDASYQYEYNPERTGQLASANFGGTYASANLSFGAGLKYAF